MINSAEEYRAYAESDDLNEFEKIKDNATDEIWLEIISKYPWLSSRVAFNHTISITVLEALSKSYDVTVRFDVATKRRINRSIFERLSRDEDAGVRHRIACNPKTPQDILKTLVVDSESQVSDAAKKRIKC